MVRIDPPFITAMEWNGHLEGVPQSHLGDVAKPWYINHLLNGMILQVHPGR